MSLTCPLAQGVGVRRRTTFSEQASRRERVECLPHLSGCQSGGVGAAPHSADRLRPVQAVQQCTVAWPAEDQRGVRIDAHL